MAGFKIGELYTSTQINKVLTYTGIYKDMLYYIYKPIGSSTLRYFFQEIMELENFNTQERTYKLHDIIGRHELMS